MTQRGEIKFESDLRLREAGDKAARKHRQLICVKSNHLFGFC